MKRRGKRRVRRVIHYRGHVIRKDPFGNGYVTDGILFPTITAAKRDIDHIVNKYGPRYGGKRRKHSRRRKARKNPLAKLDWWLIGGGVVAFALGWRRLAGAIGLLGGLYEFNRGRKWIGGVSSIAGASFLLFPAWPSMLTSGAPAAALPAQSKTA